jgi:hypothetical protein
MLSAIASFSSLDSASQPHGRSMGLRLFSCTEYAECAACGRRKAQTVYAAVCNARPFEVGDCHARAAGIRVVLYIQYLIYMFEFIVLPWLTTVTWICYGHLFGIINDAHACHTTVHYRQSPPIVPTYPPTYDNFIRAYTATRRRKHDSIQLR